MQVRQKIIEGAFLKIPLDEEFHSYGRIIGGEFYSIYEIKTKKELELNEISSAPFIFTVGVFDHAVKSKRWEVIGILPLEEGLKKPPLFFTQDILNPEKFQIYENKHLMPATRMECENLERFAVWEPENVEQRIRDYFDNKPNYTFESLKIKS